MQRSAVLILLFGFVALHNGAASSPVQATTRQYFATLKEYLGEDTFAQFPCLAEQEKHGWQSPPNESLPMDVFTLGVEGSGHHLVMSLIGPRGKERFSSLNGHGGAHSVPMLWRHPLNPDLPLKGMHPDITEHVSQGQLIIATLRYPPSSLLSLMARFSQCQKGHRDGHQWPEVVKAAEHNTSKSKTPFSCRRTITAETDLLVLHEALSAVDDVLRFPGFDCSKFLLVPIEMMAQKPMVFFGPLVQALRLKSMKDVIVLHKRLVEVRNHESTPEGHHERHVLHEMCCSELGISNVTSREQLISSPPSKTCAERVYKFAQEYFDSRSYMFPSVYPSLQLVETSKTVDEYGGLIFKSNSTSNDQ